MFTAICHCRHCQKQSGSAFSVNIGVSAELLSIEGDVATFQDRGESGGVLKRQFCSNCGSPLFSIGEGAPGVVFVKAGTLDDTSKLSPKMEIWTDHQQPWVKLDLAAVRVARQPS
ncbi:MAG: GFA family protein [Novosphingobium sp.]